MPSPIPGPNRSPPARVHLESTVESVLLSPSAFSLEKRDKKEKKPPSLGLWASVKAKAAVFHVFDRGKPAEAGPPPGSPVKSPSRVPPLPPFQGALDADYDDYDSDEGGKLKNEHDRTLRRSVDIDQRRRHSARITITNEQGEVNNYPYRPRGPTLVENPSTPSLPFAGFTHPSLIDQSTTALSAVGSQSDARQALLDFPDLGNAVERYIRHGTPSVTSLNSEEASPVKRVTDGIIYNIPYDENEIYDEDFDFLGHVSPGADATPKPRARGKSVRFASHDSDINARVAAKHAVETHKRLMNSASLGIISENGSTLVDADEEKDNRPKCESTPRPFGIMDLVDLCVALLPRPAFTTTAVSQKNVPRTPSPTKTIRQQRSNTFLAKRSPSPIRKTSPSSNRNRIPSPLRQPLGHKESMSFRGRSQSPLRTPRRQGIPPKGRLAQHRVVSPSKSCLSYESPNKTGYVRLSEMKGIPDESKPQTPATPTALTMENTRLNTPTLLIKLTPVHSRTPTSPAKPTLARSQSPASSSKFCFSPMSPFTTETSSLVLAKEAHALAAAQKAAEVAKLKRKNLDMLAQKKSEDEERLKLKKSEIAMKRKASQSALRLPDLGSPVLQSTANSLTMKRQASQSALRSPTLASPALSALRSPALNKPRQGVARLPVLAKKESKLPVLVKKESSAMMRRPGLTPISGLASKPTSSVAPVTMATRAAAGLSTGLKPKDSKPTLRGKPSQISMAASARGESQSKPKDSKSSLRDRPSQIGLGQKARSALTTPKPVIKSKFIKSKLGQKMENPE